MKRDNWPSAEDVAQLVRQLLEEGCPVEIDGLGVFQPLASGNFEFVSRIRPCVFIAYGAQDLPHAQKLYEALTQAGMKPWLDKQELLPGQNWPRAVARAIERADYFVACFSRHSINKRGQFQSELRFALDCASRLPLDAVYLIPVRLDDCRLPARITQEIQYVDLFPNWEQGVQRVVRTMQKEERGKLARHGRKPTLPPAW
jgi:hypothetical protein